MGLINAAIETICNIDKSKGKSKCNDKYFVDWVYCLSSPARGEVETVRFSNEGTNSKPCKIEHGYNVPSTKDKHDCSQHKFQEDCAANTDKFSCSWSKTHEDSSIVTQLAPKFKGRCLCGNGFKCCTSDGRVNTCKKA